MEHKQIETGGLCAGEVCRLWLDGLVVSKQ